MLPTSSCNLQEAFGPPSSTTGETTTSPETQPDGMTRKAREGQRPIPQSRRRRNPAPHRPTAAALLVGFAPEEVAIVRRNLSDIFPPEEAEEAEEGCDSMLAPAALVAVLAIGKAASRRKAGALVDLALRRARTERAKDREGVAARGEGTLTEAGVAQDAVEARGGLAEGRVVLLYGPEAQVWGCGDTVASKIGGGGAVDQVVFHFHTPFLNSSSSPVIF